MACALSLQFDIWRRILASTVRLVAKSRSPRFPPGLERIVQQALEGSGHTPDGQRADRRSCVENDDKDKKTDDDYDPYTDPNSLEHLMLRLPKLASCEAFTRGKTRSMQHSSKETMAKHKDKPFGANAMADYLISA